MAPLLARCIIWGWLALGAVASDDADLYRKVTAVNTSECLDKVRALPLKVCRALHSFKFLSAAFDRKTELVRAS